MTAWLLPGSRGAGTVRELDVVAVSGTLDFPYAGLRSARGRIFATPRPVRGARISILSFDHTCSLLLVAAAAGAHDDGSVASFL